MDTTEKKLDGNYTRMLQAILNMSWKQHPTKQQLYGHLPPITKTIKIGQTRHMGHCWRSRNELMSNVLLWTPSHGWAKAERPARTYIQQLYADTRWSPEDLLEAMDDRERWRERVRDIHADSTTWWWWVGVDLGVIVTKGWQHAFQIWSLHTECSLIIAKTPLLGVGLTSLHWHILSPADRINQI